MVEVRPLRAEDEARWRALWRGYLAYYETTRPEAVYAATFRRLLDPAEPMHGRVSVAEGEATGLCHHIFHRHCWFETDACYLQDLFVAPERRGDGSARALIENVYREADEAGAASVYWLTQEFNYRGRALYDRVAARTPFIKYQRPA